MKFFPPPPQITSAILLLNLLIALMNSTVQRIHDERETYWKFVRAGIWVGFFDERSALPPPFTVLAVAIFPAFDAACKLARRGGLWPGKKCAEEKEEEEDGSKSWSGCRRVDRAGAERRRAHARLMSALVERTLEARRRKSERKEEEGNRARIREVVEEVLRQMGLTTQQPNQYR